MVIVKIVEWTFLKENMWTESKRVYHMMIQRGRGALEKIIMSNSYIPVLLLGGGGPR